ncbi:hypothetical protein SAMN05444746_112141 [Variovorax sp. OK212]|nr:hypothetical protein SAMN05518853_11241 [Variovorax sp. OK202]SFD87673.1 hypothetical protein SAMN05444746_112141 [Variovorax sp. OK212]
MPIHTTTSRPLVVIAVMALMAMVALETTVVATAMPQIAKSATSPKPGFQVAHQPDTLLPKEGTLADQKAAFACGSATERESPHLAVAWQGFRNASKPRAYLQFPVRDSKQHASARAKIGHRSARDCLCNLHSAHRRWLDRSHEVLGLIAHGAKLQNWQLLFHSSSVDHIIEGRQGRRSGLTHALIVKTALIDRADCHRKIEAKTLTKHPLVVRSECLRRLTQELKRFLRRIDGRSKDVSPQQGIVSSNAQK